MSEVSPPRRDAEARSEPRRYGGEYDGYCLAPPKEQHLRAADAQGLRLGIFWHVWIAYHDPKLVWC